MGLINIFQPLSTILEPAPLINLGNIDDFSGKLGIKPRGSWVRSKNATTVLCSHPMILRILIFLNPLPIS